MVVKYCCYCLCYCHHVVCDFRTIFTGEKRYTYIDPDYSYADSEARLIQQHKQRYIDFIETLRSKRLSHLAAM